MSALQGSFDASDIIFELLNIHYKSLFCTLKKWKWLMPHAWHAQEMQVELKQ